MVWIDARDYLSKSENVVVPAHPCRELQQKQINNWAEKKTITSTSSEQSGQGGWRVHGFDVYNQMVRGLSRRHLLRLFGAVGGAACLPALSGCQGVAPLRAKRYPFRLGVASGDPSPDGAVIWTRLAPEPLEGGGMPKTWVEVGFEVAEDDRFQRIVRTGTAIARPELGHAVHVELEGLKPGHDYWYRFFAGDAVSQTGRTRTAPEVGARVDGLRFASCGCSHIEAGYFTAYRRIAEESFDFIYHAGDYIYEAGRGAQRPVSWSRRHRGGEPYTLVDYRNRYALYKTDPDLIAAHASAPFIVSWDDHEIDNDWAADFDQDGTPPELFLLRRAAAYQAYYEHMPLRRRSLPTPVHLQLFRQINFGRLLSLNVLDTRQYRSKQVCHGGYLAACPDRLDPHRSLLGLQQEAWLFERLSASETTWNVLAQQVPMFSLDQATAGGGRYHMDKWDGYEATRARLFQTLDQRGTANPVVLSGDVHTHWASDVKARPDDPESKTLGVELTATSITSGGDGSPELDFWPAIRSDNPHVHYHSNRRGYLASEVTEAGWEASFKTLETVTRKGAPAETAATVMIQPGRYGIET